MRFNRFSRTGFLAAHCSFFTRALPPSQTGTAESVGPGQGQARSSPRTRLIVSGSRFPGGAQHWGPGAAPTVSCGQGMAENSAATWPGTPEPSRGCQPAARLSGSDTTAEGKPQLRGDSVQTHANGDNADPAQQRQHDNDEETPVAEPVDRGKGTAPCLQSSIDCLHPACSPPSS